MPTESLVTDRQVDKITAHYITAALWSSTGEDGEPLDADHDADDLTPQAHAAMREDVADFLDLLDDAGVDWAGRMSLEQFGHDLWLTRNGHGAGFWDRGLGELGDALTHWARTLGEVDLFVTADGRSVDVA